MSNSESGNEFGTHQGASAIVRSAGGLPDPFETVFPGQGSLGPVFGTNSRGLSTPSSMAFLWRFRKTVILVFLLVAVPAIALIWTLIIPVYRVEAQVRVRPLIPRLVFNTEDNGQIPFYQSYLNTQVSVMLSPTVIQRALDQSSVQQTEWYRKKSFTLMGNPPTSFDRLRKSLVVFPRGMTEIIDISMTDPNPKEASTIVNAVLDQYLKFIRESTTQADDLLYRKLMEEYNTLRGEIEGREAMAAKLRKELGTTIPDGLINQQKMRIDQLEGQLKELRREIATEEWRMKELKVAYAKEAAQRKSPVRPEEARYQEDADWKRLHKEAEDLAHNLEVQSDKLGENHPSMVELRRRVKISKESLKAREVELDNEFRAHSGLGSRHGATTRPAGPVDVVALEGRIKLLKHQEQLLINDIKEQSATFGRMFDLAQTLNRESELINYKRDLYGAFRNRIDQKEIERNVPGSIEVLARAYPPSEPYHDRRILLTVLSLFAGLGAGATLAFFRASTNQTVTEAEDIPPMIRSPFLGQLPLFEAGLSPDDGELSLQSESMRMVRTSLLQRIDGQRGSTIMVTSAGPGAGKTTVAVMLATSLTKCGKRVLLVDADIRNASVCERMGIEPGPGLLALLTTRVDDTHVIVGTDTPGLSVLPAGKGWNISDHERLANGAFSACLDRWRKRYDLVLIDSPPVLSVADARIISRQMDGTIMVIREDHCRRSDIMEAMAYLGSSGGKLVGTVFIGSRNLARYRKGHYGAYYGSMDESSSTKAKKT